MLARLLATENISVVHENVPTAFFDLGSRSLHLPMWSNVNGHLYDMLVGHEVAHALWTDRGDWTAGITTVARDAGVSDALAKSALNIVEDARIERLIQNKFRGLRADFAHGYRILHERKFFGDISDINTRCLADRVNIHFKCGITMGTRVHFNADERALVDHISGITTWAQVVDAATRMLRLQKEQAQGHEPQNGGQGEPTVPQSGKDGADGEQQGEQQGEPQDGDEKGKPQQRDGEGEDAPTTEHSGGANDQAAQAQREARERKNGEMPTTQDAFEDALKRMSEADAGSLNSIIRVNAPDTLGQHKRIDFTQFLADMEKTGMREFMKTRVRVEDYTAAASIMATAFNRRKAADTWRRTSVSKTGSLCTLRMNAYKWNEDIFRRATRVSDGKNHGIIILLDWSGSMHGIMQSVIGQLFILTDFCRKCGVPFEVFAFSDQTRGYKYKSYEEIMEADAKDPNCVKTFTNLSLLNFLSSRMNSTQYETAKSCLWQYRQMGAHDHSYSLGGTPGVAALVALSGFVGEWIKRSRIQIAHTVVLTDGEATDRIEFNHAKWAKANARKVDENGCVYTDSGLMPRRTAVVLTDPITGASYDLARVTKSGASGYGYYSFGSVPTRDCTDIAVDMLRRRTGSRVHWISLVDRVTAPDTAWLKNVDKRANWKRDGFVRGTNGKWDSVVLVDATRFVRDRNGNVGERMQKVLDKADQKMENAKTDRALASAFIDSQIAKGSLRSLSNVIGEYLATN